MKTHFKTLTEAKQYLDEHYIKVTVFDRQTASEALKISKATLHRLRGQGAIEATETVLNGHTQVTYKRDEVAKLLYKRGI